MFGLLLNCVGYFTITPLLRQFVSSQYFGERGLSLLKTVGFDKLNQLYPSLLRRYVNSDIYRDDAFLFESLRAL